MRKQRPRFVCECLKVTREQVLAAVRTGARTLIELRTRTGAGGGCTACHPALRELIERGAPRP
jgi:bacterioferritin-associated ferredoxin